MSDEDDVYWSLDKLDKKKPANLNAKTMDMLHSAGWEVELTQSFSAHSVRSKDMFGFADIIAFAGPDYPDEVVLVQACSSSSRTNRIRKILNNATACKWVISDKRLIWVVHWNKSIVNGVEQREWNCRIEFITEQDFINFNRDGRLPRCPQS